MSARNIAFQSPKLLQPFPKVFLCFSGQKVNEKRTKKTKKNKAKVAKRFRVPTVLRYLFSGISGLKSRKNVREYEKTANFYLPRTAEGIAESLKRSIPTGLIYFALTNISLFHNAPCSKCRTRQPTIFISKEFQSLYPVL